MADDRGHKPTPRPRRRRTDIDPNAPSPPVSNERRSGRPWTGDSVPPPSAGIDVPREAALAASVGLARTLAEDVPDATTPFHVPGLAAAVATEMAPSEAVETTPVLPLDETPSWLHGRDDRSIDPVICPFLRAASADGLVMPIGMPDPANRCAALASAVPQSLRQQELVCLSMSHVNCPRYLRGTAVIAESPAPVVRAGRTLSPAMLGSLVVLVFALTASVGFVLSRNDGLSIARDGASAAPSAPVIAVVSPSTGASVIPASAGPTLVAASAPVSPAAVTPVPTPSSTPTSTPTPEPTARRTPRPKPTPDSDRYRLLRPCGSSCWVYRVRAGDNLFSIANYFGVPMASIYSRNPRLRDSGLRAGMQLRLPPPTR